MKSSQIRAEARKNLAGKWGKAALITLVYLVISYILSFALNLIPFVGYFAALAISVPLSFGLLASMFKLNDNEEVPITDFISTGFANFGKVWGITLNIILKFLLPILAIMVSAFILGFGSGINSTILVLLGVILCIALSFYFAYLTLSYQFSLYILYDNPDISGKEAVEKCKELISGHIWELICLYLSFIGWWILAAFTLGIGLLWLQPYMKIAEINFYRNLTNENT